MGAVKKIYTLDLRDVEGDNVGTWYLWEQPGDSVNGGHKYKDLVFHVVVGHMTDEFIL
jgi:hypothetical protein